MADQPWDAVDQYLCDHLLGSDETLDAILLASQEGGLPSIAVAPNQGKLLHLLVRSIGARRVLEVGTLGGYSTTWLARALPEGGRVITLEVDPNHAEVAQANLERAGVGELVEIRLGAALASLEQLAAAGEGPFDFVFIDADKENTRAYFEWSLQLAHPGTLIVVDNVIRGGALIDETTSDSRVLGMREFFDYVSAEKRVDITAVQTVGSKGYDGFALAYVKES